MVQCKSQNTYCPDEVSRFKGRTADGMFSLLGVKLFADGALGSWGAALLDPYDDKPDHKGTMLLKETELDKVVKEVSRLGPFLV